MVVLKRVLIGLQMVGHMQSLFCDASCMWEQHTHCLLFS